MDNINYLDIFKKAWKITWQNKYLWWFGLFMLLGSGGRMNWGPSSGGSDDSAGNADEIMQKAVNFINEHLLWIIVAAGVVMLLAILFWILKVIAQAGLIKTLQDAENIKNGTFGRGMKIGKEYFWKLAGMNVLLGLSMLVILAVMITPVAFLFYLESYILAILSTIMAIVILIPLLVLVSFLNTYGQFYVVASNLPIRAALETAYGTFRKNILSSIVMSLLFIPIGIVLFFGIFAVIITAVLVLVLIGIILNLIMGEVGIIIAIVIGILACLGLIFFAGSAYQVFWQTSWWLFFREIAGIKKIEEEKKNIAEELIEQENVI